MPTKTIKKKLIIKVLFDTNVIYTGSANDLLRSEVIDLLKTHSSLTDISIDWYIPEIVMKERIFQMNKKGADLLPSIEKLERLLGHKLNINKDIVGKRIEETVKEQVKTYGLEIYKIDTSKVDREALIHSSVNRFAPFEDSDKEKGFRDALVLESFKQIIEASPSTPSICRIILITGDRLLNEAAQKSTLSRSNIHIFNSIEEFIELINIIDSKIKEDLVSSVSKKANQLFFEPGNKNSLYYTEGIYDRIMEEFSSKLNAKPKNIDDRKNGVRVINKPTFENKDKQKIFWKTIIEVKFTNFKNTFYEKKSYLNSSYGIGIDDYMDKNSNILKFIDSPVTNYYNLDSTGNIIFNSDANVSNFTIPEVKKEQVSKGITRFEVIWSVTITTNKIFKNPKIEKITYIDTITEES